MHSRRKFLFGCSAVAAALGVAPLWSHSLAAIAGGGRQSLAQISYLALAAQANTTFRVRDASGQMVKLKLLKAPLAPQTPVRPGRRPPGDAGNEKFSLIFSGPKERPLAPAIHQFEHDRLGRFEMYIGQIGTQDTAQVRYQAVFNRPAPTGCFPTPLT